MATESCPEEDRCREAERGRSVSDLDFLTFEPPVAGCLPFSEDTDITTSVDTPSCSGRRDEFLFKLLYDSSGRQL